MGGQEIGWAIQPHLLWAPWLCGLLPDHTDVVEVMKQSVSGARPQVVLTSILGPLASFPLQLHALVYAGVRFQRRILVPTTMSVQEGRQVVKKSVNLVALRKLHVSRSQKNCTMLQYAQPSENSSDLAA
jgi:hypothetical protein